MEWKTLLGKIVRSKNDRELKKMRPLIEEINACEPALEALSLAGLGVAVERPFGSLHGTVYICLIT